MRTPPFTLALRLAFTLALSSMTITSIARADAIMPFEGDCPPGLDRAIASHSEVCRPRACTSDAQCGSGAACREIAECWAPRPFSPSDGREENDEVMRDQVIGLCAAGNACAEGHCETRRQCEPTERTDAWDPAARRWTAEPYRAPSVGCVASPAHRSWPLAWVAIGAALTARRRRSQV